MKQEGNYNGNSTVSPITHNVYVVCMSAGSELLTTLPPLYDTIDEWPDASMCA